MTRDIVICTCHQFVRAIKYRRFRRTGNMARMSEEKKCMQTSAGIGKRRSRGILEDNVKIDVGILMLQR
jgi:hypothetical protein